VDKKAVRVRDMIKVRFAAVICCLLADGDSRTSAAKKADTQELRAKGRTDVRWKEQCCNFAGVVDCYGWANCRRWR